jgi:DNA polymerase-3 subunit gamma/tau
MSYQVLARKWRPRSFSTLVGQEHVVRALSHALEQQRLHHAYLFTGTRGVGKTTLARILAKALNCETGVTAQPCGVCSACTEIDNGRFVDLLEVDAATNTRVDEMRQLLENAAYAPTRGRFKVYVIDEVHMLSNSAFNAMLKTLEEPPEHIKFILATTDPQKIPVTVLSRCLQFNLKQMPPQRIVDHLSHILAQENVPFEAPALRHLAKAAAGSMRDALSLLDQAIAHGAGRVEETAVREMLGTVGEDHLYAVLDALAAGELDALLAVAKAMDERSLSFDAALQELATLVHRVALVQMASQAIADEGERKRIEPYARAFDAEFLQLAYQILVHGRAELPLAPDEHAGFSMTLLRLFAFRPETPVALGAAVSAAKSVTAPARGPAFETGGAGRSATSVAPATAQSAPATSAEGSVMEAAAGGAREDGWHELLGRLRLGGMVRELAQHCELAANTPTTMTLRLSQAHRSLLNKTLQDKLQAEIQAHLRRPVKLAIEIGEPVGETPAQRARTAQQERHERAVAALEQDGFVRDVIDMFDATLNESSIKPV